MDVHYKELIDSVNAGVYFVDRQRRINYWNKAAEKITGFSEEMVLGKNCHQDLLRHIDSNGTNLCESGCPLLDTITSGVAREAEVFLHHRDGHRVPVLVRTSPIRNGRGDIIGAVELFTENSFKIVMMDKIKELEEMAMLDPLTRLGNRRFTEMHLHGSLEEFIRYGNPFGILMLDIDHFKRFNDTYGHDVGDRVIVMVAGTLMNSMRPSDYFGRWGGEEFIGVIKNVDEKGLMIAAERIRMLVQSSFLTVANENLHATFSIGGAMVRSGDSVESLIKKADEQLYRCKHEGRNRVSICMDMSMAWMRQNTSVASRMGYA